MKYIIIDKDNNSNVQLIANYAELLELHEKGFLTGKKVFKLEKVLHNDLKCDLKERNRK